MRSNPANATMLLFIWCLWCSPRLLESFVPLALPPSNMCIGGGRTRERTTRLRGARFSSSKAPSPAFPPSRVSRAKWRENKIVRSGPGHLGGVALNAQSSEGGAVEWQQSAQQVVSRRRFVRQEHGTEAAGKVSEGRKGRAENVLESCLQERGLKLQPCGQDCMGAIAHCVHWANVPNLGLDSPDPVCMHVRLCMSMGTIMCTYDCCSLLVWLSFLQCTRLPVRIHAACIHSVTRVHI